MDMVTPHNAAKLEDIAKTVLMPGDPKRSKYIAEHFLDNARLVNDIRGAQGYTGEYKGIPITTMSSGMGIPSMGLYCYELFKLYDVDNIIRVGTVGGISPDVSTRDVIIAETAFTNSNFYEQLNLKGEYIAHADAELLKMARDKAEEKKVRFHSGAVLTMELYYSMQEDIVEYWQSRGALGFEMETACLYAHAEYLNKKALSILTVSNNILTGEELPPEERETKFSDMVQLALDVAIELQ